MGGSAAVVVDAFSAGDAMPGGGAHVAARRLLVARVLCLLCAVSSAPTVGLEQEAYTTPWQVQPSLLDPYLDANEKLLVAQCTSTTSVCSEMEMRVYAVTGCEDEGRGGSTTYCTLSSAVASPPPLTVVGRGFGTEGVRMWVGSSECAATVATNYTAQGDPHFQQVVCTGYSFGTNFREAITVMDRFGNNATGPAGIHIGPPVITAMRFNDSASCRYYAGIGPASQGVDSFSRDAVCWDDTTLVLSGHHFPTAGVDFPPSFLASASANDPPATAEMGVMLVADGVRTGPRCTNVRTYVTETEGTLVACDLRVRGLGMRRNVDLPGTYALRLWWGSVWASGNVTVTVPRNTGRFVSATCGDYVYPEYIGPEAYSRGDSRFEHHLSMASDSAYLTSLPLMCSTGTDELVYFTCCAYTGVGVTASSCTVSGEYNAAVRYCNLQGYRLCTKEELLTGQGNAATTGCSTALRRTWVSNEGCFDRGRCLYSRPFVVRGTWYTDDPNDFELYVYAIESGRETGVGNWTCDVVSLGYVADPDATEGDGVLQEIVCEPKLLSRSGLYGLELFVKGEPHREYREEFVINTHFDYQIAPEVTAVSGCYDLASSTTRCPSRATAVVTVHGSNFDEVIHVSIAGRFCDMNLTAATAHVSSVVTPTAIYCYLGADDMDGIESTLVLHTPYGQFPSARYVSVSFVKRPRVDETHCFLPGGVCPTKDGPLYVTGVGFDSVVWATPSSGYMDTGTFDTQAKLFIAGVECERLEVYNGTMAVCWEYDVRGRLHALRHEANPSLTIVLRIGEEEDVYATQQEFRKVPFITRVAGCESFCDYRAQQPITVIGGNFSATDTLYVHVAGDRCITQTLVDSTTVVCSKYHNEVALREHPIRLQLNGEWSMEEASVRIIALCNGENGLSCSGHGTCTHHAECVCDHSRIDGYWQGESCSDCVPGFWGDMCRNPCLCPTDTGTCNYGVNGTGLCDTCRGNFSGSLCDPCPGTPQMQTCGLRGRCNDTVDGDGTCTCDTANWDPQSACFGCAPDNYGPECLGVCPGGRSCSGHGACSNGLFGTGRCTCEPAWGGAACENMCAGGILNTCHGHGICDLSIGACRCFDDPANGHWAAPACSQCQVGWSGSKCLERCAVSASGVECTGHGHCGEKGCMCSDGFCSFDCSRTATECSLAVCLTDGLWGNDASCPDGTCGCECPLVDGLVCSGRGSCDSGEYGTGRCVCHVGVSGVACEHDCSHCSVVGGICDDNGRCNCRPGYFTDSCARACPGAEKRVPCGGVTRGVCSDGNFGSGKCTCAAGYAGLECLTECAGGKDNPCSGHGECSVRDGTCACTSNARDGFWDGTSCEHCIVPFLLPTCNETCPGALPDSGVTCSGHGLCNPDTAVCLCQVERAGSWGGNRCDECLPGFFGADCAAECPGGACNQCNGHGVCHDGVLGSGQCQCIRSAADGHWDGATCEECHPNYYGPTCKGTCPGLGMFTGVCRKRGVCDDGRTGTGECLCDVPGQMWTGVDCNTCQAGFWGEQCMQGCPSSNTFLCSGHGSCSDGTTGFGNCSCHHGWVGDSCSLGCPGLGSDSGVCGGHGDCYPGSRGAACECHRNPINGYWAGFECATCASGYYGIRCTRTCPGDGGPCSGRGVLPSCNVVTGECKCQSGWAGPGCNVECAGGSVTPCSLHGVCDSFSGACRCHASPTLGYWTGATCSVCHAYYASPDTGCKQACPLAKPCEGCSQVACSGYGQCVASQTGAAASCVMCSDVATTRCGDACEISGNDNCQKYLCSGPRWGLQCQHLCPGVTSEEPFPCSSHGFCDSGKAGSGTCVCDQGYVGPTCSLRCPDCVLGRGECGDAGTCVCLPGFGGTLCEIECPGSFRSPCGQYNPTLQEYELHGTCNSGQDVTCTCNEGWRGVDCNTPCQGMLPDGRPCNGNGVCLQHNPTCLCTQDAVLGYWSKEDCSTCSRGFSGENCTTVCEHGTTQGRDCACDFGWFGSGCSEECVGKVLGPPVQYCRGHGMCDYGSVRSGTCQCDVNYYGVECETYCVLEETCQKYLKKAVVCGAGGCGCINNNTHGHWQGDSCEMCGDGHWGSTCLQVCACSGNAVACDQLTGQCSCYSDAVNGYFHGAQCEMCQSGYIGTKCTTKDAKITRASVPVSLAPLDVTYQHRSSAAIVSDDVYGRLILAATPPAVYSLVNSAPVYSAALSKNLAFLRGAVLSTALQTTTLDIMEMQGGTVDLFSFHRKNLTLRQRTSVVKAQAVSTDVTLLHRSHNVLSKAYGVRRRDWVALQSSQQAFGTLMKAVSAGSLWCLAYQFPGEVKLRVVSTSSGKTNLLHDQFLANFDRFSNIFVLDETHIAVAGSLQGRHDLTAMELDPQLGVVRAATNFIDLPTLSFLYRGAAAALRYEVLVGSGVWWYAAVRQATTLHVLQLSPAALFATPAAVNAVDCSADPGTMCATLFENVAPWTVQNARVDAAARELYVTVLPGPAEPTWVYRLHLSPIAVSGSMQLSRFAGEAEVAQDVAISEESKAAFILPRLGSLRAITVNTYYVERLIPNVADSSGGTRVTVVGRGFRALGAEPLCRIEGAPASVVSFNKTTVVCVTAATDLVGGCNGASVDVSFEGPERYTANDNAKLRRVFSATPLRSIPDMGIVDGGTVVTVKGYGFDSGGYLTCEFYDDSFSITSPATFVKSTEATCVQPAWPRPSHKGLSFLRLSQDGTVPSQFSLPFNVVGTINSLEVAPVHGGGAAAALRVICDTIARFPGTRFSALDSSGQAIQPLLRTALVATVQQFASCTTAQGVVSVSVQHNLPTNLVHIVSEMPYVSLGNGTAILDGLYFSKPLAAFCVMTFEVYSALPGLAINEGTVFTVDRSFEIVAGRAQRLSNAGGIPTVFSEYGPLHPNPTLRLLDIAGNAITAGPNVIVVGDFVTDTPGRVLGRNESEVLPPSIAFSTNPITGVFECTCGLVAILDSLFGVTYRIEFSVLRSSDAELLYDVPPLVTPAMMREPCSPNYYGVLFTPTCAPCPYGGFCDGTWVIRVRDGFWRWRSDNYTNLPLISAEERGVLMLTYATIHACSPASACGNGDGVPTEDAVCSLGYDPNAILCRRCRQDLDYAFASNNKCSKCFEPSVTLILSLLIVGGASLVVASIVYWTYIDNVRGSRSDRFVEVKQVITWLQTISLASEGSLEQSWPAAFGFYEAVRKSFNLHSEVAVFNCLISTTYYGKWLTVMLLPLFSFVGFSVVALVLQVLHVINEKEKQIEQASTSMDTDITFIMDDSDDGEGDKKKVRAIARGVVESLSGFLVKGKKMDEDEDDELTATTAARFCTPVYPALFRGVHTELCVSVTRRTQNDVTLIPSGPGLTFVPPFFVFSADTDEVHFSMVGHVNGEHSVSYRVTGTDRKKFPVPTTQSVVIFEELRTSVHDKVISTLVVLFFFCFPVFASVMAGLIPCMEVGPDGDWFLQADPKVQCYTHKWWSYMVGNILFFLVYMVACPAACVYYTYRNSQYLEHSKVRLKFGFLFRGLKPRYWYWELVCMARKVVIALIGTLTDDLWNRIYSIQWVLAVFLFATIFTKPYLAATNNFTEVMLLAQHMIVMNLALIYFTRGLSPVVHDAAGTLVVVLNFGAIAALIAAFIFIWKSNFVLRARHARLRNVMLGQEEEVFEKEENTTWKAFLRTTWHRWGPVLIPCMGGAEGMFSRHRRRKKPTVPRAGTAAIHLAAAALPVRENYITERLLDTQNIGKPLDLGQPAPSAAKAAATAPAEDFERMRAVVSEAEAGGGAPGDGHLTAESSSEQRRASVRLSFAGEKAVGGRRRSSVSAAALDATEEAAAAEAAEGLPTAGAAKQHARKRASLVGMEVKEDTRYESALEAQVSEDATFRFGGVKTDLKRQLEAKLDLAPSRAPARRGSAAHARAAAVPRAAEQAAVSGRRRTSSAAGSGGNGGARRTSSMGSAASNKSPTLKSPRGTPRASLKSSPKESEDGDERSGTGALRYEL